MFYLYEVTATANNYGSLDRDCDSPRKEPTDDTDDGEGGELTPALPLRPAHDGGGRPPLLLNIDEAIQRLGMGLFQYRIMLAAGLVLATDSMEVVMLSFLSHVAKTRWDVAGADALPDVHEGDVYGDDGGNDALLSVAVFPAALVGALVWGVLGDAAGRRAVFISAAAVVSLSGVATALAPSYPWLLVARVGASLGVSGLTVPFDVCAEIVPPRVRGRQLAALQSFWTVGGLLVHLALQRRDQEAIAAESADEWRWVAGLCALPCVVATVLATAFLPESPRWLLSRGEPERALQVLRDAARVNGRDPWEEFPEGVILFSHEHEEVTPSSSSSWWWSSMLPPFSSVSQIFNLCSSRWMSVTSALWTVYFFKAFLDHGTVSMAVTVFSNDDRQQDYQAFFSASAELLALTAVFFTIDVWGRSALQCVAYACGGVICLTLSLLEDHDPTINPNLLLFLAFSARLFVSAATTTTWVATTEVLSTAVRTTGHGTAHAVASIGGALSTYLLARIYSTPTVGLILFVTGLWTASAASRLPETGRKEMGAVHHPTQRRSRRGNRRADHRRRRPNCRPSSDQDCPVTSS